MEIHFHFNELIEGNKIMATLQEVKDAITQAAASATAEKQEVTANIQALTDQVAALQSQIASGSGVTAADLDALLVSIQGVDQQVKDITVPAVPV